MKQLNRLVTVIRNTAFSVFTLEEKVAGEMDIENIAGYRIDSEPTYSYLDKKLT